MTDLTPDHPAVEVASKAWAESHPTVDATWDAMSERLQGLVRVRMVESLKAAIPYLTDDNRRNAPAADYAGQNEED